MPGSGAPRVEPALDGLPLSDRKSRSLSFRSEFCKCSHGDTRVRIEIHKHLAQTVCESPCSISDSPSTRQQTAQPHAEGGAGDFRSSRIHPYRGRASETGVSSCGRTAFPQANQTLRLGNDRSAVRVRAISRGDRLCSRTAGVTDCGTGVRKSANDVFESGETDDIPT